ncbi:MAG: polysaccharide biosynthesis tyrosine autokinase [Bacteroidia bacterium]|nr:polysaccharide biosynthesis tyrosine autokinase [Bacteroidia bacterium]
MFQTNRGLSNHYGDDTIDVKSILRRFTSRWYYFLIGVFLFGSLGYLFLQFSPNIYRVQSKVILDNQNAKDLASEQFMKELGMLYDKSTVEDKAQVLSSFNLIRSTIKQLPLEVFYYSKDGLKVRQAYKDAPFYVQLDTTHNQLVNLEIYIEKLSDSEYGIKAEGTKIQLYSRRGNEIVRELDEINIDEKIAIGTGYESSLLKFDVFFREDYDTYTKDAYFFKVNTLDGLAENFQGGLEIAASGTSNILDITSEGPVVEIEKSFINKLLETYKRKELREMRDLGYTTVSYLDSMLADVTNRLERGRNKLQASRVKGGAIDVNLKETTVQREIGELERERLRANNAFEYYKGAADNLNKTPPDIRLELPAPAALGIQDQVLTNAITKLSELYDEREKMSYTVLEGAPEMEVNRLAIENNRRDIIMNVNSSLKATETELRGIETRLKGLKADAKNLPLASARNERYSNEIELTQEEYTKLTQKRTEAMIAVTSVNSVDIEVIESARLEDNKPISPKKPLIMLVALFLGMALPVGLILVQDFFHDKIVGRADIESSTNIPVLGFVARHDRNSNYIVPKDSRTALAESFRSIRIKMQYLNDNVHQQVVGLTSSSSGEGKTFCSTNLAAIMAQAGKRTLLIDVDLRRPRVTRYFENGDGSGLSSYLAGDIDDYRYIVHQTHIENLDVIHSGPVCTNPLDLISTDKMTALMETFRQEYDHIVLDTPPVGLVSDYLIIMKLTDFNVYVVRDSTTSIDSLKWINELYDNDKIKNIAMVINDVKSVAAYGYINNHYGYGD